MTEQPGSRKLTARDYFNIALLLTVVGGVIYLVLLAADDSGAAGVTNVLKILGVAALLGMLLAAVRILMGRRSR